ncbi:conserved hypothetical protein [Ricinus communis]|uniref:Uncharacterized protein n=1 Tax=Ricinus communis TaxID=3988 RepID=B9RHQ7_RICCO|nr:conserved hypothetical protein [Ricinus communis]
MVIEDFATPPSVIMYVTCDGHIPSRMAPIDPDLMSYPTALRGLLMCFKRL